MSEEKLIKYLEYILDCLENTGNVTLYAETQKEEIKGLLDLYNKQKEEIDYYKKQNEIKGKLLNTSLNETRKHCISKDKIRDKIKELEKKEKNCNFTGLITECEIKIETLKELLEE